MIYCKIHAILLYSWYNRWTYQKQWAATTYIQLSKMSALCTNISLGPRPILFNRTKLKPSVKLETDRPGVEASYSAVVLCDS